MGLGLLLPEYEELGPELHCPLKVIFSGCEKIRFKLIKIKIVSFFSVDHNDIFDHKYYIYPGNLFSMLKYQYLT